MADSPQKGQQTWHTSYVFVSCTSALILLAGAIYFGPQTITYYKLRGFLHSPNAPRGLDAVPKSLLVTEVSGGDGTTVSYYGYAFEAPLKGVDQETREGHSVALIFTTGQI